MKVSFDREKKLLNIENKRSYLIGGFCRSCNEYSFPKREVCSECMSEEVEAVELSGNGTVHAAAVVKVAPFGFEAPYAVSYVDLEEGPRIFTQLTSLDEKDLIPGTKVKMVVGTYRVNEEGNEIVGYKFEPIK